MGYQLRYLLNIQHIGNFYFFFGRLGCSRETEAKREQQKGKETHKNQFKVNV
jgi:hypothetical protein